MTVTKALKKVVAGESLTLEESEATFLAIFNGAADNQAQIGSLLTALHLKGESAEEIAGAAKVLRAKAEKFTAPEGTIDVCGTGGDGLNTLNISTAAAFIVAACGVPIAKHGNRAVSSACGSADVLEALGIKIDVNADVMERSLAETNFAFLLAPKYHPSMRRVMDVRKQLGFRTIFNLIGPLANPARVKHQLIGVSDERLVTIFSEVAYLIGIEHTIIVSGDNGMDEISLIKDTHNILTTNLPFDLVPLIAALEKEFKIDDIKGGDANYNATALRKMLLGDGTGAFAEAARVNAAAGLIVSGKFTDFAAAYAATKQAIESRKAYDILHQVMAITNEHA